MRRPDNKFPRSRALASELLRGEQPAHWMDAKWAPTDRVLKKAVESLLDPEVKENPVVKLEACASRAILWPQSTEEMRALIAPDASVAMEYFNSITDDYRGKLEGQEELSGDVMSNINYEYLALGVQLFPELQSQLSSNEALIEEIAIKLEHERKRIGQSFMDLFLYTDLYESAFRVMPSKMKGALDGFPGDDELVRHLEAYTDRGEEFGELFRRVQLFRPGHRASLEFLRPKAQEWAAGGVQWIEENQSNCSPSDFVRLFQHLVNARVAFGEEISIDRYGRLQFISSKEQEKIPLPARKTV